MNQNQIFKKTNREIARKNWVAEQLNQVSMWVAQKLDNLKAELDFNREVIETILIEKLNVKKEDIQSVRNSILERNAKDREIINKYIQDESKTKEERLQLMKNDGLSEPSIQRVKFALKIN
jgi:hypothetical protein